ncbi:MAG: porin [Ketobacteraceae bacterium]|nr:porin [Ketobacteraceae bacterium]
MRRNWFCPVAAALCLGTGAQLASAANNDIQSELDAIKADYQKRIEAVERKLNVDGKPQSKSPVSASFSKSYLTFESADGNYKMKIDGRIMIDIGYVDNDDEDNHLVSDNDVRRARLAFKMDFYKDWAAEFDMDLSGNEIEIKDLWLAYNGISNTNIKFGNHKPFFSMAESTTSRWYPFVETSMISDSLAPGRRLAISGSYWQYPFFVGATLFGNELEAKDPDIDCDDEEVAGEDVLVDCDYEDPDTNQDYGETESIGYAVRGAFRPWYTEDGKQVVHLGAGYLRGKPQSSEGGRERVRFRAYPESRVARTRFVDAKINGTEEYQITYLEFASRVGNLTVQSEIFEVSASPLDSADGDDFDGSGYYIQGSYFLSGEGRAYSFNDGEFGGVTPTNPNGDLEAVIRFSEVDFNDDDAFDGGDGGEAESITLGANWYVNTNIVFRLNYSLVDLGENADADGDFIDEDDLKIVTLRTQVMF